MISVITMQIRTKQWKPLSATITCQVLIFTHKTEALISYHYLSGTHFYAQNGSPYQLPLLVRYSFLRTKQWKPLSATITCQVLIFTYKTMEALISYDCQVLLLTHKTEALISYDCQVLLLTHKTEALISYDYLSGTHFNAQNGSPYQLRLSGTNFNAQNGSPYQLRLLVRCSFLRTKQWKPLSATIVRYSF